MIKPLKIAIVGTTGKTGYSGGRVYALTLAYQLASSGNDIHFIANHRPQFFKDWSDEYDEKITFHLSKNFSDNMPEGIYDYVIIIPTGIFHPQFYENALSFTKRSKARVCLLNFETADWYNTYSSNKKNARIWDYWRRCVLQGGLVMSCTEEANSWAKKFYFSMDEKPIAFDVCSASVNTNAADRVKNIKKDDSILAFVRSQDAHKGGDILLNLHPDVYKGRCLKLISGQEFDDDFIKKIKEKLKDSPKSTLELHEKISDESKFELLAAAKVLLFPSRFEGYGAPPLEAAYMGTHVVCFELPVLMENLGEIAHFAKLNDVESFSEKALEALNKPQNKDSLRQSVSDLINFKSVAVKLNAMFRRNLDKTKPYTGLPVQSEWGPWDVTPPQGVGGQSSMPDEIIPVLTSISETTEKQSNLHISVFGDININKITDQISGEPLFFEVINEKENLLPETLLVVHYHLCAPGCLVELNIHDQDGKIFPFNFIVNDDKFSNDPNSPLFIEGTLISQDHPCWQSSSLISNTVEPNLNNYDYFLIFLEDVDYFDQTLYGGRVEFSNGVSRYIDNVQIHENLLRVSLTAPLDIHNMFKDPTVKIYLDEIAVPKNAANKGTFFKGLYCAPGKNFFKGILLDNKYTNSLNINDYLKIASTRFKIKGKSNHSDGTILWLDKTVDLNSYLFCEALDLSKAKSNPHNEHPHLLNNFLDRVTFFDSFNKNIQFITPPEKKQADCQGRPKILFLSLIPVAPADQGNKVVTKNFINTLINKGYDIDVLIQNYQDHNDVYDDFKAHVKVYRIDFPSWRNSTHYEIHKKIQQLKNLLDTTEFSQEIVSIQSEKMNQFHPFYIIKDEFVHYAKALMDRSDYSEIVCNYTATLRAPSEISTNHSIPDVKVITHDALSMVPSHHEEVQINHGHSFCSPDMERNALNSIAGIDVIAITQNEADYFDSIGVTNPITVCENDSYTEFEPFQVNSSNFGIPKLIFHGSSHAGNIAGINWFIQNCWKDIRQIHPNAELSICGKLSEVWKPEIEGIKYYSNLPRDSMLALLGSCSVAINPMTIGTGLKIKTVETACLGLPAVFLQKAIDGLENIASDIGLLAHTADEFTKHVSTLLSDQTTWERINKTAIQASKVRFTSNNTYAKLIKDAQENRHNGTLKEANDCTRSANAKLKSFLQKADISLLNENPHKVFEVIRKFMQEYELLLLSSDDLNLLLEYNQNTVVISYVYDNWLNMDYPARALAYLAAAFSNMQMFQRCRDVANQACLIAGDDPQIKEILRKTMYDVTKRYI